jgi:hypothetical protein
MAESQTKTSKPKDEETEKEPTFTVAQLLTESRSSLGVASHIAAGAFHGLDDDRRFTRDEAKDRVEKFLKRKAS